MLPFTSYSNKKADLHFNKVKLVAADGDADSQFELAGLYTEGEGGKKDMAEAFKWYHKAA